MNTACKNQKCGKLIPSDGIFCPYCGQRQAPKQGRRRLGNGSGYAYKRGKTWTLRVTLGFAVNEKGDVVRQYRTKGGFATKAAALRYADQLKGEKERKAPTLSDLWSVYLDGPLPKLSNSKQTAYKIAWKKLAAISTIPIDKLGIKDLNDCVADKAPTFYPARDMKTVLSKLWDYAIAEQYVNVRLPDFIELPTLEETEPDPFSEIEIHSLWRGYGDGDWFTGYILLMIYTGMMPGELLDLRMGMIDWGRREIVGAGKKTKERKKTPLILADFIVPVLDDLCQRSQTIKDKVCGMNKDKFYEEYYACLERNKCRRLTPYACRHTTATALALGNIAPSVIQKVMRHTKFTTTQRYIHPDTASMKDAVNTLNPKKQTPENASAVG